MPRKLTTKKLHKRFDGKDFKRVGGNTGLFYWACACSVLLTGLGWQRDMVSQKGIGMSFFVRDGFDAVLADWPGVSFVDQWDAHIAKVGSKVFCLLGDNEPRIVIKVTEMGFEMLTALAGVQQAPYFAKGGWVEIASDAPLEAEELAGYVRRSYALVAKGLTKKLRLELGITDNVGEV